MLGQEDNVPILEEMVIDIWPLVSSIFTEMLYIQQNIHINPVSCGFKSRLHGNIKLKVGTATIDKV